jgi:hypothetical protein
MNACLVHPGESAECAPDLDYGSVEYRAQGFTLANPRFVNRYFNEELYILVRFRIREVAEEYIACFKRVCNPAARFAVHIGSVGSGHAFHNVKRGISNVHVLSDAPIVNECSARNEQAMFVDVVETMESPKRVIHSLLWCDRADNLLSLFPYSLYFSSERFLFFWGERDVLEDWKVSVDSRFTPVCSNQSECQIIKSATKVLDDVPGHEAEQIRNDQILRQAIERLLCVRIALYNDGVWVGVGELAKGGLEVAEVMLGPLCL